jgi:hypothetical protein
MCTQQATRHRGVRNYDFSVEPLLFAYPVVFIHLTLLIFMMILQAFVQIISANKLLFLWSGKILMMLMQLVVRRQ